MSLFRLRIIQLFYVYIIYVRWNKMWNKPIGNKVKTNYTVLKKKSLSFFLLISVSTTSLTLHYLTKSFLFIYTVSRSFIWNRTFRKLLKFYSTYAEGKVQYLSLKSFGFSIKAQKLWKIIFLWIFRTIKFGSTTKA